MNQEAGQVTVLAVGLAVVTFAVAGLAVDGTRAFLLRRTLQNAADAAALAGAAALDTGAYYSSGGQRIVLDREGARREALAWLSRRGVRATASVVVGESNVSVILRGEAAVTFLALVGLESVPVATQARAEPMPGPRPPRPP